MSSCSERHVGNLERSCALVSRSATPIERLYRLGQADQYTRQDKEIKQKIGIIFHNVHYATIVNCLFLKRFIENPSIRDWGF